MNLGDLPAYLRGAVSDDFDLLAEDNAPPADGFVLPFVPEAKAEAPSGKAPMLDASDELEQLIPKTFRKLNEIMDLRLDKDQDDLKIWQTTLRAQMTAVQTVLNTQVRVDDQRLRRRVSDNLPALLENLARHEHEARARRAKMINGEAKEVA